MRVLLQRVSRAAVIADGQLSGEVEKGLLLFLGIEENDGDEDIQWLCDKLMKLRIFSDETGKMNHSVEDVKGGILVISQFTLHASTKKGARPSFIRAAKPDIAIPLYEQFLKRLKTSYPYQVANGKFGADMQVELVNDGPVTIWIDSKNRE